MEEGNTFKFSDEQKSNPTLDELNAQIEQVKAQLFQEVNEPAVSSDEKVEKTVVKHWSKSDFANAGMPVKLTTVDKKTIKNLKKSAGKEGQEFLAEATRPFAVKSAVTTIVLLAIFIVASIIISIKFDQTMILLLFAVMGILFVKPSKVLDGYTSFGGGFVMTILSIVSKIMCFEFLLILLAVSMAFGGNGGKAKQLQQPKIGIPRNIGLDELINQGEAYDCYYKMMNIMDRGVEQAEIHHYENKLKDYQNASAELERMKTSSSSEYDLSKVDSGLTADANKVADLQKANDLINKGIDDASSHLDRS